MTEVAFLPLDLARWDGARGEALAVFVWSDVRPLPGAAGLLDWRLCGRLSAWIEAGRMTGAEGEQTLVPPGRRLPWRSVVALGLGERAAFTEATYCQALGRAFAALRGLGVGKVALALPGRDVDAMAPGRAIELLLAEAEGGPVADFVVVDTPAAQKEMAEVLKRRRG